MPYKLTKAEERAMDALRDLGRTRASYLGERLWSDGYKKPQAYARPAAKILKRLVAKGYVYQIETKSGTYYRARCPQGGYDANM